MNLRPFFCSVLLWLGVLCGGERASAQFPYAPAPYTPMYAQRPPIFGQVISLQRGLIAGVTVSLVHPVAGRSQPATSGQNGFYSFGNVPPQATPYFLEAYWGNQLLFRQQVLYQGGSVQCDIRIG